MIHSYGKRRSIRHRAEKEARKRVETRDAILWEVLPDQRVCRVKLQGSDKLVSAYYPENWMATPSWLKPGNSVRVLHASGNRNRLEVIGDGGTVPTPLPGGAAAPTPSAGANCILSGMEVLAFNGLVVSVAAGTYRINDVVYNYEARGIRVGDTPPVLVGQVPPVFVGSSVTYLGLSSADSSLYRMDLLCIGIDGVLDYLTGTPDATNPEPPAIPPAHVKVATVLVPPATTAIQQWYINYVWVEPFVAQMSSVVELDRLTWTDAHTHITVTVLDQYGNLMPGSWRVTAEITDGTGTLSATTGYAYNGTVTFTYYRMDNYNVWPYPEEHCPVLITFTLVADPGIIMLAPILLEDEFGVLII